MAYEKVTVERRYHPYKTCKKGDVLAEGNFVRTGEDQFGGATYEFRDPDQEYIDVLNSSGHLNYLMKEYVNQGDWCRITYLGKDKIEKGKFKGKDSHRLDLDLDPDRRDVSSERSVKVEAATSTPTEESTPSVAAEALGEMVL